MSNGATKTANLLPFRVRILFAVVIFIICLAFSARAQPYNRLVILASSDMTDVLLKEQIAMVTTDFRTFFGIADIHQLRVKAERTQNDDPAETFISMEEALLRVATLCSDVPGNSTVIAFIFPADAGPTVDQIEQALHANHTSVAILANSYFRTNLSVLTCGRYSILDYSRGGVRSLDTIQSKDHHFPIIPVVLGAGVVTTGVILLTGGDEAGCTTVDPGWNVPAGLCIDGGTITLVPSGTPGGIWSGTGVSASGIFSPASGSQPITYTVGEGSCQQSRVQTIIVIDPDAEWAAPSQPCAGETTVLIPASFGGAWSGSGVIQNPDGTANFTQSEAGSYSVTYTVMQGACQASSTQDVEVHANPDASWSPPSEPLCAGEVTTLIPSGTTGGIWTGNGITDLGNGTATFVQNTAGSYSVTYIVLMGTCQASITHDVEVLDNPDASWSPPSGSLCAGEATTLTPSGTSGGTWTGDGITDLGNGTATFVQNAAGTYMVTYTVTSGNCTTTLTQDISVIDMADPSWTAPGETCSGDVITLTATGTAGGTWSGQGVTDNGDGTATFSPDAGGTYTVTYAAGTGACMASLTLDIPVTQNPDASWSPPSDPLCAGEEATLIPSGTSGGSWTGNGVTDLGNGTATFVQNSAGTYTVTYTVISGSCMATVTQDISVIDLADPAWTGPNETCSGNVLTLTPTGTAGGTWSGQGVTDNGDGTATFSADGGGTYTVTYTAGAGACMASLTLDILVSQTPDASWSPPSTALCSGDVFDLTPTGTPGGIWSGQGVTDLGNGTGTFSQTEAGDYEVTYTITSGPCSAASTQTIMVILQPDASWSVPSDLCSGSEVTLVPSGTQGGMWSGNGITDLGNGTALFSPSEEGAYDVTYVVGQGVCEASLTQTIQVLAQPDATWNVPTGICTGQDVILIPEGTMGGTWSGSGVTDLGNGTASFTQNEPGVYEVTYTVSNGACIDSSTQQIEVLTQPDPDWTVPQDVCTEEEVLLTPNGTQGGTWSGPGVTDLGNGTANFIQNNAGFYTVTYSVGQGACVQELTQDIEVISTGDPAWTPPGEIICPGAIVDLVAPEGTWSGIGVTDFGGGLGQFQSSDPGIYTITLTVGSGDCTASEAHDVEVGDLDPPVIDVPASDLIVTCDGTGNMTELQNWLDTHGGAEASDACSAIVWDDDFTSVIPDCGGAGTATVTFTATDASGNTDSTVGVFTIEDTSPPVLQGVPPDIVVSCDAIPPPAPVSATDVCSGNAPVDLQELPPGTGCPYEIVRIWTATDACGNTVSAQQTITATDDQPPVTSSMPHDTVIFCPGPPETCIPPPAEVMFTDNCDPNPAIMITEEIQPFPPNNLMVIRCWTATDVCGNISAAVCHVIQIISETQKHDEAQAPELTLAITNSGELITDSESNPLLDAGNISWHDPGQVLVFPARSYQNFDVTRSPSIAITLEVPLETGVSLALSGGYGMMDFSRHYILDNTSYYFEGLLRQNIYRAELRFTPPQMQPLYFSSGMQFTKNRLENIRLVHDNQIAYADSRPGTIALSQFLVMGVRLPVGEFVDFEAHGSYLTGSYPALDVALRFRLGSLFTTRKQK